MAAHGDNVVADQSIRSGSLALISALSHVSASRRAFSIVELMVVIGVIAVLMGILLPMLGGTIEQARLTADMGTIRSNAALVMQYADQNNSMFPRGSRWRCGASREWFEPLVEGGLLSNAAQADPRSFEPPGGCTFFMSESLVASVAEFTWGSTRSCAESPSSDIALHQVLFPSAKGMMVKAYDPAWATQTGRGERWFCCAERWVVPVVFCDGSAEMGDYLDFSPQRRMPVINWGHLVGVPVLSPWGGAGARER